MTNPRYTLLQVRNPDDPMREHEREAFARVLETATEQIQIVDLLSIDAADHLFADTDMFLLGGSGHYSAAGEGAWLDRALTTLRKVHQSGTPTFASCWGFQAMARAMGGRVINDLSHAEVGTHELYLTDAGREDPVFSPLGDMFLGQMGHEDCVAELPPNATLLASSPLVENQAYRFNDRPIYCTQFHPELSRADLMDRVAMYPKYVVQIAKMPSDEFCETIQETRESEGVLKRFAAMVFGE